MKSLYKPLIKAAVMLSIVGGTTTTLASTTKHAATQTQSTQSVSQDNPFSGAAFYLNPDYQAEIDGFFARNPAYVQKAKNLKLIDANNQFLISTGLWIDNKGKITNNQGTDGHGIRWNLEQAYAQAKAAGKPVVITLLVYDLPNRDCDAFSSNGEIKIGNGVTAAQALAYYENNYITPYNTALNDFYSDAAYPNAKDMVKTVLLMEPDSLPNMITNSTDTAACQAVAADHVYQKGIAYALDQFSNHNEGSQSIYLYLDIAHSGWLGWEDNANKIASIYNTNSPDQGGLGSAFANVRGFVTNTSNATPLTEAFSYDDYFNKNIIQDTYYQWNDTYSEQSYMSLLLNINASGTVSVNNHKLTTPPTNAFYRNMHFIVDTSRNGWLDSQNRTLPSTGSYQRYDVRHARGNWCNVDNVDLKSTTTGASLGEYPVAAPQLANLANPSQDLPLDAYMWVKPPGESDGYYNSSTGAGDQMCGNGNGGSHNNNQPTDSLQDGVNPAPKAGAFFDKAFMAMIDYSVGYVPPTPPVDYTTSVALTLSVKDSAGQATTLSSDLSLTLKDSEGSGTAQTCTIPAHATTASCDVKNSDAGSGETFLVTAPATTGDYNLDATHTTQSIHMDQGVLDASSANGITVSYAAVQKYIVTVNVQAPGASASDTASVTFSSGATTQAVSVPVNDSATVSLPAGTYHVTAASFTEGDTTFTADTQSDLAGTGPGATKTVIYTGKTKPAHYTTPIHVNVSATDDQGATASLPALTVTLKDATGEAGSQTCTVPAGSTSATCSVDAYNGETAAVSTTTPDGFTLNAGYTSSVAFAGGSATNDVTLAFTKQAAPVAGDCTVTLQSSSAWGNGAGTAQTTMNVTVTNNGSTTISTPWTLVITPSATQYTSIAGAWSWVGSISSGAFSGKASESWEAIAPGASVSTGMNINSSSQVDYNDWQNTSKQLDAANAAFQAKPSSVTLNGKQCTVVVK